MFLDWRLERKWSVVGFCTGAICGLVAIVSSLPIYPSYLLIFTNRLRRLASSAFVGQRYSGRLTLTYPLSAASIAIGFLASGVSNLLTSFKVWFRLDDPMLVFSSVRLFFTLISMSRDIFTWCATMPSHAVTASHVFCSHGVSGIVGLICTGLFAQASVAANDAFTEIDGGWFDQSKLNVLLDGYLSDTLYRLDPARLPDCLDLCWFWLDLCDIVHSTRHHRSHSGTVIYS